MSNVDDDMTTINQGVDIMALTRLLVVKGIVTYDEIAETRAEAGEMMKYVMREAERDVARGVSEEEGTDSMMKTIRRWIETGTFG